MPGNLQTDNWSQMTMTLFLETQPGPAWEPSVT